MSQYSWGFKLVSNYQETHGANHWSTNQRNSYDDDVDDDDDDDEDDGNNDEDEDNGDDGDDNYECDRYDDKNLITRGIKSVKKVDIGRFEENLLAVKASPGTFASVAFLLFA